MRYGTLTSLFSAATVALIGLINVLQPSPGVIAAAATGVSDSISTPLHAIRIWHLTDVHFNLWHDRRGNVRDMCRTAAADASLHPGKFGHFNCDPDFAAVELAVARMTEAEPAPDMILFGGDVFGHVPASHENSASVRESHEALARALQKYFPRTPVLPCLGNHDTIPYFAAGVAAADALGVMARLYGSELAPSQRRSLASRGYYVHKHLYRGGGSGGSGAADDDDGPAAHRRLRLWVVVLETNALSIASMAAAAQEQLTWFVGVLRDAAAKGSSVLVLGHIAPGASHIDWDSMAASGWEGGGWTAGSQSTFYRILREEPAAARISAMLFGHLHTGSIRLLRPSDGAAQHDAVQHDAAQHDAGPAVGDAGSARLPVMYLSPSLTPRNPTPHLGGMRLYVLAPAPTRRAPLALRDIYEHAFDLDASNARNAPFWRVVSVRLAYNLSSLSYGAWERWAHALREDARFAQLMSAQRCADEVEPEYGKCKASVVCAHLELEPAPYAKCIQAVRAEAVPGPGWTQAVKRPVG